MRSYLKFLSRNKLYTAIEAVGLAVSLAFVIVIGFSVWDQLMIAKRVPGSQNLYLLGPQQDLHFMEYRDKEALASIPEIQGMAAFQRAELTVQAGEEFRKMPVLIADSQLLEMLRIGVRSGSIEPLKHGQGVALTASAASRMFPGEDPVGQALTIGAEGYEIYGERSREVTEIVAVIDAPTFSILDDYDVFCPMESNLRAPKEIRESNIRANGYGRIAYTFATLVEGADLETFSEKYLSLVGDTINRDARDGLMATDYRELYFSPEKTGGIKQGNRLYLYIMIILGLVLLLSAVLNYINLSSALFGGRAKEMATRRLLGDSKRSVFWRIMSETLLFTLVCYVLAVLLATFISPYLDSLRPEDVPVAFRVAPTLGFWLLSIALILLVSLVSGMVPAILLSSYQPVDVISGKIRRRRKMGFNKACIIVQSLLALVLICLSISLRAQLRHLESLDLGVDPQGNLFYYHPSFFYTPDIHVVGDKLSNLPQIKRMAYTSGIPAHVGRMSSGPQKSALNMISCDTLAFKLLGFRIQEPFSEVKPGTIWISNELRNYSGVSIDSLDISLVLPYNSGSVSEIGGVIEDFRKLPVNTDDYMGDIQQFRAVEIPFSNEGITGILMETGPDHDAFKQEFTRVVTEHYKSTIGVPDLTISSSNQCGYLDEITAADYASLHRFVQIITLVGLIAVFLAMLGLMAMSAWFAGQNAKEIAIRKVFGSDERSETLRSVRSYMILTLVAAAIGIPVSIVLIRRFLESYAERISGYWWIFALALVISLAVSFVSVLWQTLKAAKTNPSIELKKE
jgi:ABC-type antimicrobial peptide transport system permease subunit